MAENLILQTEESKPIASGGAARHRSLMLIDLPLGYAFVRIGPDLLFAGVMTVILLVTVWVVGGHIRFLQASMGLPIGIVIFLIIYREILARFRPGVKTNVRHILRDWLPFLLVTFIYENMHDLSQHFAANDIAATLYRWDVAMFGVEPTLWAQKFFSPLLTDIMSISYALYFILPLVIMFFLSNMDWRFEFRKMAMALTFTFLMGFVGYVVWPASPPRYLIPDLFTSPHKLTGLFLYDRLQGSWDALSVVSCGAFPSLHVGASAVALFFAWKYRNVNTLFKWIWRLYIPLVLSLWVSTVYLRHHWVIDIFAGLFIAIIAFILSEHLLNYWKNLKMKRSAKVSL